MLTTVVLPLVLAFIMFSLGLGLTLKDFSRVLTRPKAFGLGALSQLILLPIVAFILLMIFDLPPALEVGVMILSFCPGGTTSNMITRFARGDVALSVTLTAVISLAFIVTLPVLVPAAVTYFQGAELAAQIPMLSTVLSVFAITVVPVFLGVVIRRHFTAIADRIEGPISLIAAVLFVILVLAIIALNIDLLLEQLMILGPMLVLLNLSMLALGWFVARLSGLDGRSATTIAIEAGVQNATLGITVAAFLWAALGDGSSPEFSVYALPSAAYGVAMYFVTAPFVVWRYLANKSAA